MDKSFRRSYLQDAPYKVEIAYPFDRQVSRKPRCERCLMACAAACSCPTHTNIELLLLA